MRCLAFSQDGSYAVSGGDDKTIQVWDMASGALLGAAEGHTASVTCLAFSHDGSSFVSGHEDAIIRLWDVSTKQCVRTFGGHSGSITDLMYSGDGRHILSCGSDGSIRLWSPESRRQVLQFKGRHAAVAAATFLKDDQLVISGGLNAFPGSSFVFKVWEVSTGKRLREFPRRTGMSIFVSFSTSGEYAVFGTENLDTRSMDKPFGCGGTTTVWDLRSEMEVHRFSPSKLPAWDAAFFPDNTHIVFSCSDNTIRLWSLALKKEVHRLEGGGESVGRVAVSPDGRYVLFGSSDGSVSLWKVPGALPQS